MYRTVQLPIRGEYSTNELDQWESKVQLKAATNIAKNQFLNKDEKCKLIFFLILNLLHKGSVYTGVPTRLYSLVLTCYHPNVEISNSEIYIPDITEQNCRVQRYIFPTLQNKTVEYRDIYSRHYRTKL